MSQDESDAFDDVVKPEDPWEGIVCESSGSGRRYWRKTKESYTVDTISDLHRWLKSRGLSASVDYKNGETLSKVDKAILKIQENCLVEAAGRYAGWRIGIQKISGRRVLVTGELELIRPAAPTDELPKLSKHFLGSDCSGWPNIGQILYSRFDAGDPKSEGQVETCLAVLQRVSLALYAGRPQRCQAMVLAGDPSAGKSLIIDAIIRPIMGDRAAYPLEYMLGTTDFNSEMHEAALWKIDDEATKTKIADRKRMGGKVKQYVAVKGARLHEKGKKAGEIETMNLLVFAVNLEEQNLLVLPPLDNDLEGKIHLFKYHNAEWPCWPLSEDKPEEENAAILRNELPYFLYWLINEFEVPENIREQRFGVKSFYHEEILEKLDFLSNEVRFYNLVERYICRAIPNSQPTEWKTFKGTCTELVDELLGLESLPSRERTALPNPHPTVGQYLSKLSKRPAYRGCIEQVREGGTGRRLWRLISREAVQAELETQGAPAQKEADLW